MWQWWTYLRATHIVGVISYYIIIFYYTSIEGVFKVIFPQRLIENSPTWYLHAICHHSKCTHTHAHTQSLDRSLSAFAARKTTTWCLRCLLIHNIKLLMFVFFPVPEVHLASSQTTCVALVFVLRPSLFNNRSIPSHIQTLAYFVCSFPFLLLPSRACATQLSTVLRWLKFLEIKRS